MKGIDPVTGMIIPMESEMETRLSNAPVAYAIFDGRGNLRWCRDGMLWTSKQEAEETLDDIEEELDKTRSWHVGALHEGPADRVLELAQELARAFCMQVCDEVNALCLGMRLDENIDMTWSLACEEIKERIKEAKFP